MAVPVIEVRDLWFSYNGRPTLRNVNLEVEAGDFIAVIGPNGGGKTTLVKLMLGLLQPERGEVRVFGLPPAEARDKMGYAPQEGGIGNRFFPISVLDVVLMGRLRGGGGFRSFSKVDREICRRAMERVGVWEFRRRRISELSGGQRQRVFVARALASEPELIFLDEPTANVDKKGESDIYRLLRELNRSATIIVVSHDMVAMSSYVRSVICVSQDVHFHNAPEITKDMLEMAYHCPVELIAHGLPHRVLNPHGDE
ncbi:MAG: ABC transporter ATP-binding protein [Pseudomonadota bacterium]